MKEFKRFANDGRMYTKEEFVVFYGTHKGLAMRKNAGVEEAGTTSVPMSSKEPTEVTAVSQNKTASEFKRLAHNGYMYTLDEFVSFYGASKGIAMWESAGAEEPPAGTRAGDQGAWHSFSSYVIQGTN